MAIYRWWVHGHGCPYGGTGYDYDKARKVSRDACPKGSACRGWWTALLPMDAEEIQVSVVVDEAMIERGIEAIKGIPVMATRTAVEAVLRAALEVTDETST